MSTSSAEPTPSDSTTPTAPTASPATSPLAATAPPRRRRLRPALLTFLADLVVVLAFSAVGRLAHHSDEGGGDPLLGVLRTATPFVIALTLGHLTWVVRRQPWLLYPGGAVILVQTVMFGVLLRMVTEQGSLPSAPFFLTTVLVLGLGMLGWRLLAFLVGRSRSAL